MRFVQQRTQVLTRILRKGEMQASEDVLTQCSRTLIRCLPAPSSRSRVTHQGNPPNWVYTPREQTVTWNDGISTLVKENFPQITIDRTDYQLGETVVLVDVTIITSIEGYHQELVHADV